MPSILLINDNKIVSRLLQLSSQKHNYTLEEINDYTPAESAYNVIFIDSDKYSEDALQGLKETLTFDKLGFIGDKTNPKPDGFDFALEKPFLPTDFVKLMHENFRVMTPSDDDVALDAIEEIDGEDELDLDNLDEISLDDAEQPLEALDEIDDLALDIDENIEKLDEHIATQETTLTTGIATHVVHDESKEELADMVHEIDNMEVEEEALEEMDLDALEEEESIVDEALVQESIEEVEASLDTVEEAPQEIEQEQADDDHTAGVVAGVAATVATAALVTSESEDEVQEELEETLNSLDGVEAIETEEDYLVESEHKVEALADEFDSLNEKEVEKLMAGEEIVSESFSDGEEKVVEANDLEEMITRAVSKAITKEMLQEALNDMEIVVSLKSKGS